MKLKIVLLLVFCLVAFALAAKGRNRRIKNAAAKQGKMACFRAFLNCTKSAETKEAKKECRNGLHACKEKVKSLLAKIIQIKPKPAGGKGRGGHKHHRGQKQHFCNCFRRFVNCIKKQHNRTMTSDDGQKITIHEEILSNAQSAVSLNEDSDEKDPAKVDPKKKCILHFKCCWLHGRCGHGGKPKRKNRGAKEMGRRGKGRGGRGRGKPKRKGGKKPKPHPKPPSPFAECMVAARKCKEASGGSKKKLKACAKSFVRCLLAKCNKRG